ADLGHAADAAAPADAAPGFAFHRETAPVEAGAGFNAVWGSGPHDVYVVGVPGAVLHSTQTGVWTAAKIDYVSDLTVVAGLDANHVFVSGELPGHGASVPIYGSIDGGPWHIVANTGYNAVDAIVCRAPGDVWFSVNPDAAIFHSIDGLASNFSSFGLPPL